MNTPPPARVKQGGGRWWIAPAVVVGLVLVAWLVLAGLPFGRDEQAARPVDTPPTETIAEATGPGETTTLVEAPPGSADDSFEIVTTTTQAPPMTAPTATQQPTATQAPTATQPPVIIEEPAQRPPVQKPPVQRPPAQTPRPAPNPATPKPVPPPVRVAPPPSRELTPAEATATLQSYVASTDFYRVGRDCMRVENRGYRNVGYDLEVWDTCANGASRRLGRWRVDSKTREVFRQRDDGRYLRP